MIYARSPSHKQNQNIRVTTIIWKYTQNVTVKKSRLCEPCYEIILNLESVNINLNLNINTKAETTLTTRQCPIKNTAPNRN
jgi:hypothetical protein